MFAGSQVERPTEDGALAALREQYARGEIDDEEFERRRARLASNR
nr:SHOCT domain-containing protein [Halomicroarcula limicola]